MSWVSCLSLENKKNLLLCTFNQDALSSPSHRCAMLHDHFLSRESELYISETRGMSANCHYSYGECVPAWGACRRQCGVTAVAITHLFTFQHRQPAGAKYPFTRYFPFRLRARFAGFFIFSHPDWVFWQCEWLNTVNVLMCNKLVTSIPLKVTLIVGQGFCFVSVGILRANWQQRRAVSNDRHRRIPVQRV